MNRLRLSWTMYGPKGTIRKHPGPSHITFKYLGYIRPSRTISDHLRPSWTISFGSYRNILDHWMKRERYPLVESKIIFFPGGISFGWNVSKAFFEFVCFMNSGDSYIIHRCLRVTIKNIKEIAARSQNRLVWACLTLMCLLFRDASIFLHFPFLVESENKCFCSGQKEENSLELCGRAGWPRCQKHTLFGRSDSKLTGWSKHFF